MLDLDCPTASAAKFRHRHWTRARASIVVRCSHPTKQYMQLSTAVIVLNGHEGTKMLTWSSSLLSFYRLSFEGSAGIDTPSNFSL